MIHEGALSRRPQMIAQAILCGGFVNDAGAFETDAKTPEGVQLSDGALDEPACLV
jgi:hypothetical protein